MTTAQLQQQAKEIRKLILQSTSTAGSGHPSSCLSAVELMTTLFFDNFFKQNSDQIIFSKGHAAPLLYALYEQLGLISEADLMQLRDFDSPLEGHPTPRFKYALAATGSLGQGLSIGLGVALAAKQKKSNSKIYVLLGDGELAEGQIWEAMALASEKKLTNLTGIVDANNLGQTGQIMGEFSLRKLGYKARAFGWQTITIKGHDLEQIQQAYKLALKANKPVLIIAQTIKGKGVSFIEGKDNWHGKALNQKELNWALEELGFKNDVIPAPALESNSTGWIPASAGMTKATRDAYGEALIELEQENQNLVVLDAEVANSTRAKEFAQKFPEKFIQCYIAEQNMISVGVGLAKQGKLVFAASFAAFLTRSFDQLRMAAYSQAPLKIVGSHAGVSIGPDGPSQMGLEDLALFRSLKDSVVLYPADFLSAKKLIKLMAENQQLNYLRATRAETPNIYNDNDDFKIGGCQILKSSNQDRVTLVAAGITLHEALKAYEQLKQENILVRVIDAYSIKPLAGNEIRQAAHETGQIITVEDHYPEGGLAEAVLHALSTDPRPVHSLAVRVTPRSGQPQELLHYAQIDAQAIIKKVKEII